MAVAIITGASSGLGGEYVRQVVDRYPELTEIWLIARRRERLEAWEKEFPQRSFRLLSMDLSEPESFAEYERLLQEAGETVSLLINNAGFGTLGNLDEMSYESQMRMVDVNVRALTALTTITLRYMASGSHILNVCSIASFVPNPRMTVYSSTKAYVMSFTKSLAYELRPRRISVTAVCPGPMSTEFLPIAGIEKGASKTFETLPYCDPKKVAAVSLRKAEAGRTVYTPRGIYKLYRVLAKWLPHKLLLPISKA